jgi:hypothetical protein
MPVFSFPVKPPPTYAPPLTYPSNLIADGRNYFTRISFVRYQPAYGAEAVTAIGGALSSETYGDVFGAVIGGAAGAAVGALAGPIGAGAGLGGGIVLGAGGASALGETLIDNGTKVGGVITLPIPRKINEMNTMNWSEISLTGTVLNAVSSFAGLARGGGGGASVISSGLQLASSFGGIQINPFIMQYFQRPSLREFTFSWTLAPRNKKESIEINNIIRELKTAQSPRYRADGFLMDYPDLAKIEFYPNYPRDPFQVRIKPCVILGINVDYTPAGPSYINGTAAPSMINLSISLRETKLWWSQDWSGEQFDTNNPNAIPATRDGSIPPLTPMPRIDDAFPDYESPGFDIPPAFSP